MTTTLISSAHRNLPAIEADGWLDKALFPFTSRYLSLGDCTMHYLDEGEGPLLLMLAGTPMWSFMYRELIAELREAYRCVVVDLPGMGLSRAALHRGKAFSVAADWLHRLVDKLRLSDITLVVHATSGPVALDMAARQPERIRRLVISNTFAWPLDRQPRLARIVRVVSSRLFGLLNTRLNLLPRITARAGRRAGRFSEAERRAILGPFHQHAARQHLQNYLRSLRTERDWLAGLEQRLGSLRDKPALLAYGRHDNGYRAGFLQRWQQLLPNHRVEVLDEAGHFAFEDDPQQMTHLIAQFAQSA